MADRMQRLPGLQVSGNVRVWRNTHKAQVLASEASKKRRTRKKQPLSWLFTI